MMHVIRQDQRRYIVAVACWLLLLAVVVPSSTTAVQHNRILKKVSVADRPAGESGSGGGSTTPATPKVSHLNKLDDKYQFTVPSNPGTCGASVRELFLLAQPKIIDEIKARPAICDTIYPITSDMAGDPRKWGKKVFDKLINSWDTVALKYDLYRSILPSNPVVQGSCGRGTLLTPDNSNTYHGATGAKICSETTTIGNTCHSTHAVNYYYGGLVYAACQEAVWSLKGRGRILFMGYMYKKDSDGVNWLKPQIEYWFNCGYEKNLGCFTNPQDVAVHSDWYNEATKIKLTKVCQPCSGLKVTSTDFNLNTRKFITCDLTSGSCST